jgi:uncharacterized protein (DUF305 family)
MDPGSMRQRSADAHFILMMIPHHEGATQHPELRRLEAAMVRVQSVEIEQMERWYRQWFGAKAP